MAESREIVGVQLIVGMEVHIELATRTKMFSRCGNPANAEFDGAGPNALIDATVLGLPGALPVANAAAIEMAMMVGHALGCSLAARTRWDRKNYFYPDMPQGYQISQYDLPLCFDGCIEVPAADGAEFPDFTRESRKIGIIRAHLEEDAGKLLHEAPGGGAIEGSIVDWSRAGTPLLEVVTQPDFHSADEVVMFAKMLRGVARFLGVTEGVMQKGHMRFEPNINCLLTLADGRTVRTPVVEVKNLNSFRAVRGAVEYELAEQPRRWMGDGREMGPGAKVTRGWDDARGVTTVQREKEDAHDYRYLPEPDLPVLEVDGAWREQVRAKVIELPLPRLRRYMDDFGLPVKEASALVEERHDCLFFEESVESAVALGVERGRAGKAAANIVLQSGARRANERGVLISGLGIRPAEVAELVALREQGKLAAAGVDRLFGELCGDAGGDIRGPRDGVEKIARRLGLLLVRDSAALERWVEQVIAANLKVAEDVRGGKAAAAGRLVGEVMKLAGGTVDAKEVREAVRKKLQ